MSHQGANLIDLGSLTLGNDPPQGQNPPTQQGYNRNQGPHIPQVATPRPRPPPRQLTGQQIQYLQQQGFSSGLIRDISQAANAFPIRMWVIDNSSSMQTRDSHRLVQNLYNVEMMDCTRWEEVQGCVEYHSQMAGLMGLPTRFTMLNDPGRNFGPQHFSVGEKGPGATQGEILFAKQTMQRAYPSGATPITDHVINIQKAISAMAPTLVREGKTVAVILATDGLPSDSYGNEGSVIVRKFVDSLRSLEGLPVWVVIRLCTDDEKVVDFYNNIDASLNISTDVLDDFHGEALEVYLRNPWLNYALPLHRFRELGFRFPVFDVLDERELSISEIRRLCHLLFAVDNVPDPALDWLSFLNAIKTIMSREKDQWNPVTRKVSPWIDLERLHMNYGPQLGYPRQGQQFQKSYQVPAPQYQQQQHSFQHQQRTSAQQQSHQNHQNYQQQQQRAYQNAQPNTFNQNAQQQYQPQGYQQGVPQFQQQQQQQYNRNLQGQNVAAQQYPQQRQQSSQPSQQHHHQQKPQNPPMQPNQSRASQPPPTASPKNTAPPSPKPTQAKYTTGPEDNATGGDENFSSLKRSILTQWALAPPSFQALKPLDQLLASVHSTFPPAFGVEDHVYFKKWRPFTEGALGSGEHAVIKRATRKMKFFLHPDKLPRDLSPKQTFVCKLLWDIICDSWDQFDK